MTSRRSSSRGDDLAARLRRGQRQAERAARPGARDLPILRGITTKSHFIHPAENVLSSAREILVGTEAVFMYGSSIVMEIRRGAEPILVTLSSAFQMQTAAPSLLANIFLCELTSAGDEQPPVQFAPPSSFVALLLNSTPTHAVLPTIKHYATRPVFGRDFEFCGPGWYSSEGILVHGPDIEVVMSDNLPTTGPHLERLPPRLREVLSHFCLRSPADVANTVAVLLTGLLMPHFVETGKPLCLVDGNQPSLGKSLLVKVIGWIFDGDWPALARFSAEEEEMSKQITSALRDNPRGVLLIDNAKVRGGTSISSPSIEANTMSPVYSDRILGQSATFRRPNDFLWCITMNETQASPDIVSRAVPIQLHYEGVPEQRDFAGHDPIAVVRRHRTEILGELAGMVVRWNQSGRPRSIKRHRCTYWAEIIGGILEANHLPEFLTNVGEAAAEFSTALDELAAVAEAAIQLEGFVEHARLQGDAASTDSERQEGVVGGPAPEEPPGNDPQVNSAGRPPGEWEMVFRRAGVLIDELSTTHSNRAKATRIGKFLGRHVEREVPIEYQDCPGIARLRVVGARSRQRLYRFVVWGFEFNGGIVRDGESVPGENSQGADSGVPRANSSYPEREATPQICQSPASNQEDW